MRNIIVRFGIVCMTFLLMGGQLLAQNRATGEIRGTITDSTGSVVSDVKITLLETRTQTRQEAVSEYTGIYAKPYLPAGNYTVTFEKAGFRTLIRSGVVLHVGDVLRIDAQLEVGAVVESINVAGAAPQVEMETSDRSSRLTSQSIIELPVVGRDQIYFMTLLPGVSYGNSGGGYGGERVSVAGQRSFTTNFVLDGGFATFPQSYNADYVKPSLDSISEINISVNNFSSEYGNGGAVFNVITKSGTNQFHGALFEFMQNDKFGARNFFARSKPQLRWNQFGGNIGGPIKRDKAFFFFSYQGVRQRNPSINILTVPSAAMKQGDFSAAGLPLIFDPDTTAISNGQTVRSPFPGNKIPSPRLDPVAQAVSQYWPDGNQPGLVNNYFDSGSAPFSHNLYTVKGDYNISSDNRLTATFLYSSTVNNIYNPIPGPVCTGNCGQLKQMEPQATLTDTWTIKPTLLNELRLAFLRANVPWAGTSVGKGLTQQIGLKNVPTDYFPTFSISGAVPATLQGGISFNLRQNSYVPSDTVTWIKGKHILKFGGEFQKQQVNNIQPWYHNGSFTFTGVFSRNPITSGTGLGMADFVLGLPETYSLSPAPSIGVRLWQTQLFIADDFKVTPRLTLNFGVRYHARSGWGEAHNLLSNFDPGLTNPATGTLGGIWFAPQNGRTTLTDGKSRLFAPRVGFAWSPRNRLAIRGGYGIFFVPFSADTYSNQGPAGFGIQESMASTDQITPIFGLAQGPPPYSLPSADKRTPSLLNGKSTTWWPTNLKEAYTQQWHFGIQREMGHGIVFESAYVGSKGTHLHFPRDLNQVPANLLGPGDAQPRRPYPQFLGIAARYNDASSIYHSWQLVTRKQFSAGLMFQATYTLAKNIDNSSWDHTTGNGNLFQIADRPDLARGNATIDTPQRFTGALVYEMPFGHGRTYMNRGGVLDFVLGGWQMSGIFVAESGVPFTVTTSGSNLSGSLVGTWLPNRIADGNLPESERTLYRWFDTNAFVAAAPYTFGNEGRNVLRGPGFWNADFGLAKNFAIRPLGEATKVQFRADFSNVFNHATFNLPNASLGSGDFGRITSARGPRNIQMGLKVLF